MDNQKEVEFWERMSQELKDDLEKYNPENEDDSEEYNFKEEFSPIGIIMCYIILPLGVISIIGWIVLIVLNCFGITNC